jgi:hypothetical protein
MLDGRALVNVDVHDRRSELRQFLDGGDKLRPERCASWRSASTGSGTITGAARFTTVPRP